MHFRDALFALALASGLCGCRTGFLYTHTTTPLVRNFDQAPVVRGAGSDARGDLTSFRYYIQVDYGSEGIGDVARANGMTTLHYADLETTSVLGGLYSRNVAHIYGE